MKYLVIAILMSSGILSGLALGAGEFTLQFLPPDESQFSEAGVIPPASDGGVIVYGPFNDPAFSIAGEDQIAVIAPDGRHVPLHIEEKSLFREFDEIVSMKLFFVLPESDLDGVFLLRWGPDVKAENTVGEAWALAGISPDRLRSFRWSKTGADGNSSLATIEVIADSRADYYFLWYLLPISIIFALLTIRKICVRYSAD